jgi:hypothetical protein
MKHLLSALLLLAVFSSCKEDCENPVKLYQGYKLYQSWYPYKENDTLNFLRLPENDTISFYGSTYSFPSFDRVVACNCCGVIRNEYLRQTFLSKDKQDSLRAEMDGSIIKFRVNGRWDYVYDIGGHPIQLAEVTTPDSVYAWAYKENNAGHSCYYARKVGMVKYSYDNNGTWLFLRRK